MHSSQEFCFRILLKYPTYFSTIYNKISPSQRIINIYFINAVCLVNGCLDISDDYSLHNLSQDLHINSPAISSSQSYSTKLFSILIFWRGKRHLQKLISLTLDKPTASNCPSSSLLPFLKLPPTIS